MMSNDEMRLMVSWLEDWAEDAESKYQTGKLEDVKLYHLGQLDVLVEVADRIREMVGDESDAWETWNWWEDAWDDWDNDEYEDDNEDEDDWDNLKWGPSGGYIINKVGESKYKKRNM